MAEVPKVGLDFGTSNSSVAIYIDQKVDIVRVQNKSLNQPSSIFLDAGDLFSCVGFRALHEFQSDSKFDNFHFVPSIKPGLPIPDYTGISLKSKNELDNKGHPKIRHFSVIEMASMVVADLKWYVDNQIGGSTDSVVLGRPVRFSTIKTEDVVAQQRLESAARNVGFKDVRFMYEPIAAGLHYERTTQRSNAEKVMVFDFGGGTLDVSCLELPTSGTNKRANILSSEGMDLGGTDLDKDVFDRLITPLLGENATWGANNLSVPRHIYGDITEWHLVNERKKQQDLKHLNEILKDKCSDPIGIARLISLIENQHTYGVLDKIERAKIRLSNSEDSAIVYHPDSRLFINVPLTRVQYEGVIQGRIKEIDDCVSEGLNSAQLKPEDIDTVLKVGGSSRNLFVSRYLQSRFTNVIETDVFNSVAAGLAIAAQENLE